MSTFSNFPEGFHWFLQNYTDICTCHFSHKAIITMLLVPKSLYVLGKNENETKWNGTKQNETKQNKSWGDEAVMWIGAITHKKQPKQPKVKQMGHYNKLTIEKLVG